MEKFPQHQNAIGELDQAREIMPPSIESLMEGCNFEGHQEEIAEKVLNLTFKIASRAFAASVLTDKNKYLKDPDNPLSYDEKTSEEDIKRIEKLNREIETIDYARKEIMRLCYGSTDKVTDFNEVALVSQIIPKCDNSFLFMEFDDADTIVGGPDGATTRLDITLKHDVNNTLDDMNPTTSDDGEDEYDPGVTYDTLDEKMYHYLDYEPSKKALPKNLKDLKTLHPIPPVFMELHNKYVEHTN